MNLSNLSIRRPVFAVMVIGGLVVLGLVSLPRLDVALFSRTDWPVASVTAVLPGASPETIEREITLPIEELINSIDGIEGITSISSEGVAQIIVRFDMSEDPHAKAQDVRDKVALAELPNEAEVPRVERFDPVSQPMLSVLFSSSRSIRSLTELVDKRVKPRLERISGVGSVTLVGGRKREIRIWIDPLRIAGYGLAVDDVLDTLRREHVETPGGRIETERREYTVKTQGRLTRTDQFAQLVVAERGGRVIRLGDVALVEDGMEEQRTLARLDGRRGVSLLIRRQSGANIVSVARLVKDELTRIREGLPGDTKFIVAQDTSVFIEHSIREVALAIVWGAILATAVVLAFLRNWRSTLIAGVAIPTSVIASFTVLYFLDLTINNLTLIALSLSIGMLIDDAIVVVENIVRHVDRGEPRMQAAMKATDEIGLAVVATTLAICAVFVPIAFMGGTVGRSFREFGLVVTVAVCVSTLVALTLTPMLGSRFIRADDTHGRIYRAFEVGYRALERGYARCLAWTLRHRKTTVAGALAAMFGGCGLATQIPVDFFAPFDRSEFNVFLKLPIGTPIDRTLGAVAKLEAEIRSQPEVRAVFSTIGGGVRESVNEANFYVKLSHRNDRKVHQSEIMEDLRGRIAASGVDYAEFAVEEIPWMSVSGIRNYALTYAIRGPETAQLNRYARAVMGWMRESGGYVDIGSSHETGKPEIALDIARDRAADLGVRAAQIGNTLSALLAGFEVTSFEEGGERYDVRVQLRPEYRNDPLKLGLLNIRAADGQLISVRNLVNPRIQSGPMNITREDRARVIRVYANLVDKPMSDAVADFDGYRQKLALGDGYEIEPVGFSKFMQETVDHVIFAFFLAMIAMYMILASQFNSFVHPFTIMLSAPLSFIGAFAGLWLFGHSLGMMSQIGLLMLMGLVMKNGILLVDYSNKLRERGRPLTDAVLEAGETRLRPVLMTTVSTVFGMMPLAIAGGDGAEWRNSMGAIVMGGMVSSMFLTLLVVPVAYTLIDDAQTAVSRTLRRLRSVGRGTAQSPASPPSPR